MNFFEKILYALQATMKTPQAFGGFHLLALGIMFICIVLLYYKRKEVGETQLKTVLGTYAIVAFILELTKQLIWSLNYDFATDIAHWDYQWYAAPFQLCTTPIYACGISLFLDKNSKLRKAMLSYVAFVTILGSIATIIIPDNCFTTTIVVNIHTMWLHYGSFVVSVYLIMSGEVELTSDNLRKAIDVFAIFICIAMALNIGVYKSGVLNGEAFNMFYISPYFPSELPVFNTIQKNVEYPLFLMTYFVALGIGATIVFGVAKGIEFLFGSEHNQIAINRAHIKK